MNNLLNAILQTFSDSYYILFPKSPRKYLRDVRGRFTDKKPLVFAGDFMGSKAIKYQNEERVIFYEA